MKMVLFACALLLILCLGVECTNVRNRADGSPLAKAVSLLSSIQNKTLEEEKQAYILYSEYNVNCAKELKAVSWLVDKDFHMIDELSAELQEELANIAEASSKIEGLTRTIATKTTQLNHARLTREAEAKEHDKTLIELAEMIQLLRQAQGILTRKKSSMLQFGGSATVAQTLQVMVHAAGFSTMDVRRLQSFIQETQAQKEAQAETEDDDPILDGSVQKKKVQPYKPKSGDVIEVLEDTLDKAEGEHQEAIERENKRKLDFKKQESILSNALAKAQDDLRIIRGDEYEYKQEKAGTEGDLTKTRRDLTVQEKTRKLTDEECKTNADAFREESRDRQKEITAVLKAKNFLMNITSGHMSDTSVAVSFLQEKSQGKSQEKSHEKSRSISLNTYFEAVQFVHELGVKQNSTAISQLAMRMSSRIRHATKGVDQFSKVKDMIVNMIAKLQTANLNEQEDRDFCNDQVNRTKHNLNEKRLALGDATSKYNSALATLNRIMRESQEISKALVLVQASFAKESDLRQKEKEMHNKEKDENMRTQAAVRSAIQALKEYYDVEETDRRNSDASNTVVSLLEVIQEDATESLSTMMSIEDAALQEYKKSSRQYTLQTVTMQEDLRRNEHKETHWKQTVNELADDKATRDAELEEEYKYWEQIKQKCLFKKDGYDEKIAKMKAELDGLKEAFAILNGESADMTPAADSTSELQTGIRRSLRGAIRH